MNSGELARRLAENNDRQNAVLRRLMQIDHDAETQKIPLRAELAALADERRRLFEEGGIRERCYCGAQIIPGDPTHGLCQFGGG